MNLLQYQDLLSRNVLENRPTVFEPSAVTTTPCTKKWAGRMTTAAVSNRNTNRIVLYFETKVSIPHRAEKVRVK